MAAHGADGGTGSARRRRERRLRPWLRHEQQSIAAVLATVTHHSFDKVGTASGVLRNRKTATRTGKGEESEKKYTAKFRKTPPLQAAATVYYPMTDDEDGELSAGVWPAPLEEGRPQGKLKRHAGIGYEIVQIFDVPVPQMVEQLPNIVQFFAALSPVPEQVIAVPILPHDVPPRRLCRDTQLAEQLAEVPTILYFLKQRIPEGASSRSPGRRGLTGMRTLALPSLVGSAGEAVDGAALAVLTSRALAAQKEEEALKQAQVRKLEERRRRQKPGD